MNNFISDEQWWQYQQNGYLKLGRLIDADALKELQGRIDEIMQGEADLDYDRLMMQLDSDSGNYADMPAQTQGFKVPTLNYR